MTTPLDVAQYVRFQLAQLSTRSAHHEFEHLCFHLAKLRVASNLLPATGPVSAGGDQGRDFETFPTEQGPQPIDVPFAGPTQTPSAFGCSLEKNYASKVRTDLATALGEGKPIKRYYFFSGEDIPVAKRHDLEAHAKSTYDVDLVIFDAKAISSLLAAPETFWIAERFLDVPSSLFPRPPNEEAWYAKALAKWKEVHPKSHADFNEIRRAIRHATRTAPYRVDLRFWIEKLEEFCKQTNLVDFHRRAAYEIIVAALRGQGSLHGRETMVATYLEEAAQSKGTADLTNGVIILQYAVGATLWGHGAFDSQQLVQWKARLATALDRRLAEAEHAAVKAPLLETRAHLAMSVDIQAPTRPTLDAALPWWLELEKTIPDAPLYPVTEFSDRLTEYLDLFGSTEEVLEMAERIDVFVATRHGEYAAGKKSRDRAIILFKQGHAIQGIRQLHAARAKWLAGETVYGSFLSSLMLSEAYQDLGLHFAAKYHALGAAKLAIHSSDDKTFANTPRAFKAALASDYLNGAWESFLHLAPFVLNAYARLEHEPDKVKATFRDIVFMTITLHAIAERLDSQLGDYVAAHTRTWQLDDWYAELMPQTRTTWARATNDELRKGLQEAKAGEPFSDLGKRRCARWNALGIQWRATWENDRFSTAIAEEFLGQLQILLADVAEVDLYLIPTEIELTIQEGVVTTLRPLSSNHGRTWLLTIGPPTDSTPLSAIAATILSEVSLLPMDAFMQQITARLEEGLTGKSTIPLTYRELYLEVVQEDPSPRPSAPKTLGVAPADHPELAWINKRPETYTEETAKELLKNRYKNTKPLIRHTLRRVMNDPTTRQALEACRRAGWLDWHITAILANITLNYRWRLLCPEGPERPSADATFQRLWHTPETETDPPVPLDEFTPEALQRVYKILLVFSFPSLGLECRQSAPDFDGIERFLRERFAFFSDDIPHEDPFSDHSPA